MITYISALIPIIALIGLGFGLKKTQFISDDAWAGMEKLTYFILFPALLISTLGNKSLNGVPWASMLLVIAAVLIISSITLITLRRYLTDSNATFTSIFQGGVRYNTYIVFAVAQALFSSVGLEMASVAAGFMIVLINLICIGVFLVWGKVSYSGLIKLFQGIIANPLIIGCLIGWFLSLSGIGLPYVTGDIFKIVGSAALPFGLLAVGAALKLSGLRAQIKPILYSSLFQFGFKPVIAFLLISISGLSGVSAAVLIISFMVPTASSAYILAKQLGGDTEAMAAIITAQTLFGFILMPLLGWLLL